jgi:hypothetical protein
MPTLSAPLSRRRLLIGASAGLLLLPLAACSHGETVAVSPSSAPVAPTDAPAAIAPTAAAAALASTSAPTGSAAAPTAESASSPEVRLVPLTEAEEPKVQNWQRQGWKTNFEIKSVDLREIKQAAAARDVIPPIDEPKHVSLAEGDEFLDDREPVAVFEHAGLSRAYPLQILTWHEIVNDVVGGDPVLVTYCPLCNTAIGFSRVVEGQTLRFGVSANLRISNMVMWDDLTESFWQQPTGEAIVGDMTGTQLEFLPLSIASWSVFKQSFPDGLVLSRDTGKSRNYGTNPYSGYDSSSRPFLFDGPFDPRLRPLERVVTLNLNGDQMAYSFLQLQVMPVIHDSVGGQPLVVFWSPGTVSALDASRISESDDVGSVGVFSPIVDGESLTFVSAGGEIRDEKTDSVWNTLGLAIGGPLAGTRLEPVIHGNDFWFAWAGFWPDTRVYGEE